MWALPGRKISKDSFYFLLTWRDAKGRKEKEKQRIGGNAERQRAVSCFTPRAQKIDLKARTKCVPASSAAAAPVFSTTLLITRIKILKQALQLPVWGISFPVQIKQKRVFPLKTKAQQKLLCFPIFNYFIFYKCVSEIYALRSSSLHEGSCRPPPPPPPESDSFSC